MTDLYWAMVGDDEGCYMMLDGRGMVDGYVLQLEPDQWRWRTAAGEGVEANRDDAMDAAEDSHRGWLRRTAIPAPRPE